MSTNILPSIHRFELEQSKGTPSLGAFFYQKSQESKLERLKELARILEIDKYKLVFIGEMGAGKTTAICHLFDLIGTFQAAHPKNPAKIVSKTQELLATAAGGTTICEVIIKPAATTSLSIEPYTEMELIQLIEIFAESIHNQVHSKKRTQVAEKGVNIISTELNRALRNVLNFNRIDNELETLAGSYETLSSFQTALVDRANSSDRTQTTLHYETGDERQWIKETFGILNVVANPNVSIPKKIFLNLSHHVLNHAYFDQFIEIVDTKGLDSNKLRADIDTYIASNDTICIFATRFLNAPDTSILEIMKQYSRFTSKNFHHKFITCVVPYAGEPEKVLLSNAKQAEDWEQGILVKKKAIQDTFGQHEVSFCAHNILFYNALRYYHNGKLDPDYSEAEVNSDRNQMIREIKAAIAYRKQQIEMEAQHLLNALKVAKQEYKLSSHETTLLKQLKNKIDTFSNLNFTNQTEFSLNFVKHYRNQYHHNTQHAINRQYGIYEPRGIDLYHNAKQLAMQLVQTHTVSSKNELKKVIKDLVNQFSPDFKPIVEELLTQFDGTFDKFVIKVGEEMYHQIASIYFFPRDAHSPFWNTLVARRGMGRGYTNDICEKLAQQLKGKSQKNDISYIIGQIVTQYWKSLVIDTALGFFGTEEF